jgi:hypothetical protein
MTRHTQSVTEANTKRGTEYQKKKPRKSQEKEKKAQNKGF